MMGEGAQAILDEIRGHVYAANAQMISTDDRIIAGHVAEANRLLGVLYEKLREERKREPSK